MWDTRISPRWPALIHFPSGERLIRKTFITARDENGQHYSMRWTEGGRRCAATVIPTPSFFPSKGIYTTSSLPSSGGNYVILANATEWWWFALRCGLQKKKKLVPTNARRAKERWALCTAQWTTVPHCSQRGNNPPNRVKGFPPASLLFIPHKDRAHRGHLPTDTVSKHTHTHTYTQLRKHWPPSSDNQRPKRLLIGAGSNTKY